MADQFLDAIVDEFADLGYTNIVTQESPQRKEWISLPVIVIAKERPDNGWHAFGHLNVMNVYSIKYIDTNLGVNVPNPARDQFEKDILGLKGLPDAIATAGAWNVDVEVPYTIDRTVFGDQYSNTLTKMSIHWILS